jgi:hypothetical protein
MEAPRTKGMCKSGLSIMGSTCLPPTTPAPRKAKAAMVRSTMTRTASSASAASDESSTSSTSEKTSSMKAAVSVVCPAIELSILASLSSLIEMPTEVGASAQPAAKPSGYMASCPKRAPTRSMPKTSGAVVPTMATMSAWPPICLTFSKLMCMPLSMMSSVTPTVPMNDQMSGVCISSPTMVVSDIVHRGVHTRLALQGGPDTEPASIRPTEDDDEPESSFGNMIVSHLPLLAYGTMSRKFGPRSTPARNSPRMAGSATMRNMRPEPHTAMRKTIIPMSRSKETPAMLRRDGDQSFCVETVTRKFDVNFV